MSRRLQDDWLELHMAQERESAQGIYEDRIKAMPQVNPAPINQDIDEAKRKFRKKTSDIADYAQSQIKKPDQDIRDVIGNPELVNQAIADSIQDQKQMTALAQRETDLLKAEQKRIAKLLSFELAYPVEELEYLIERKPVQEVKYGNCFKHGKTKQVLLYDKMVKTKSETIRNTGVGCELCLQERNTLTTNR